MPNVPGKKVVNHSGRRVFAVPGAGGGMASEGEDIRIVECGIDDFFEKLAGGFFQDPKVIIAGVWLKLRSDKTAGNLETRGGTT